MRKFLMICVAAFAFMSCNTKSSNSSETTVIVADSVVVDSVK